MVWLKIAKIEKEPTIGLKFSVASFFLDINKHKYSGYRKWTGNA
jgi:hypothetical protein